MIDERELEDLVLGWWKAGVIDDECVDRIQGFERERRLEKYGPPQPPPAATHTSISALFADVRAFVQNHPGATVLCADDPMTRQLGWVAFKTEGEHDHCERFSISLTSIKAGLTELSPDDPLRSEMSQAEGRRRIAARLMAEATPASTPTDV
jgi:hypothetical protein